MENRLRTERIHLFTPNINVVTKVSISGKPDIESLNKAIGKAVKANEILNCSVKMSTDGIAKYIKLEKPLYTVEMSDDNWMDVVDKTKTKVFNIEDGELIRFFILSKDKEIELLIVMHHLAGDGVSSVILIEDIMNALSGKKLTYKKLGIFTETDFPRGSQLGVFTKIFVKNLNRKWLKTGKVFNSADRLDVFHNYWNRHKTIICSDQLTIEELNIIRHLAKNSSVSMNSIITSVFAQVDDERTDIGLAVNVRNNNYRGMGNYASGISVLCDYDARETFIQNTQWIHESIYEKLKKPRLKYLVLRFFNSIEDSLLDSVNMVAFGNYENKTARYVTKLMGYTGAHKSAGISNLGKLTIPTNYGMYKISNYTFVPPIIPNNRRVIGIATLGGQVSMTMHVMDDENIDNEKIYFAEVMKTFRNIGRFDKE